MTEQLAFRRSRGYNGVTISQEVTPCVNVLYIIIWI